ncbi:Thymidylate synthase ThyX [bioreactor metagenome]|uniref:Thymidylate synthase ThyX n=1 Tax=bioreactor metagenome TaxID=1076179 RepID=A0A645B6J1_9ZZZZ
MNQMRVGDGTVVLLAGGGKVYTDVAARFTRSERGLEEIIASPYNAELVRSIVEKGHLAATEFDYFLFGVEGFSRVTEVQLVRKRLASYLIKSGRVDKHGKRSYDVVLPDGILPHRAECTLPNGEKVDLSAVDLLNMLEEWYNAGVDAGFKEEELRYLKPQGTEFKALIGMNAHALLDWFKIRCCMNAQAEIRDLANKMLRLCKEASPALFEGAGPNCVSLGYCPENEFQHPSCRVIRKKDAMELLRNATKTP